MERKIPKLESFLLSPIVGDDKTEENYKNQIYKFERSVEKHLLEIFNKLNINAIVKTDPYSLPYNKEIEYSLGFSSYINDAYDYRYISREILKDILEVYMHQFRFYIYVDVCLNSDISFGSEVKYYFRYHKKENSIE
jgi:hypothetical protein